MILTARQRLQARQAELRSLYYQRVEERERVSDAQSVYEGSVIGFDANTSRYRVRLKGGGQIIARSTTNGAIALNTSVQVTISKVSSEAYIDAMPR